MKYYLEHEMRQRIQRYLTGKKPLSGIRRFFTSSYRNHQEEHYRNCCFLACSSIELHQLPEEAQALLNNGMMDLQFAFEKQLKLLTEQGHTFSQDISDVASQLTCQFLGLQLFARIQPNQHKLDTMVNSSLPTTIINSNITDPEQLNALWTPLQLSPACKSILPSLMHRYEHYPPMGILIIIY